MKLNEKLEGEEITQQSGNHKKKKNQQTNQKRSIPRIAKQTCNAM